MANSFLGCISNSLDCYEDCHIRDYITTTEDEESDGDPISDSEDEADRVEELECSGEEDDSSAEL